MLKGDTCCAQHGSRSLGISRGIMLNNKKTWHPEVINVKSPSFRKGQIMQNVPVYSSFRDLTDYSNLKNQL